MSPPVCFDLSDRDACLDAKKYPLLQISALMTWEEFRPLLEQVWRKPDAVGRQPASKLQAYTVCAEKIR